jgi:hypothetical protein
LTNRTASILAAASFFCVLSPAWGGLITSSLGLEDTTNNDPSIHVNPIAIAFPSGAAPFNGVLIGNDITGPSFSASWNFVYTVPSLTDIVGATFYLQIYDADVCTTASRVTTPVASSFTIDGTDLTGALNAAFDADACGTTNANRNGNVNKELITLPSSLYTSLLTSPATVSLTFSNLGRGVLGDTSFNGAELIYSELDLTTQPQEGKGGGTTPEPASWSMLAAGCGLLILRRRARPRG